MFVKLTRLDSSPIWINASFVVTVEPRKGGGSIVVPIGDGLDYDVREAPEAVLEALAGAPAPAVVPVPAPKGLAPSQGDVSPDDFSSVDPLPAKPAPHDRKSAKKSAAPQRPDGRDGLCPVRPGSEPSNGRAASPMPPLRDGVGDTAAAENLPAAEPDPADVFAGVVPVTAPAGKPPTEDKPAAHARGRKPRAATARKAAPAAAPADPTDPAAATVAKTTPLDLNEDDLTRLRKLAPSSVRKLQNTLLSQFHVADSTVTITALEERAVLTLDRDHVIWK